MILGIVFFSNLDLFLISSIKSNAEMSKVVKANLDSKAERVAKEIADINQNEFTMLNTLASLAQIRNPEISLAEKQALIKEVAKRDKQYFSITIFNTEGKGYDENGYIQDFSKEIFFVKANQGAPYIGNPSANSSQNKFFMTYSLPVVDENNSPLGVIAVFIDGTKMSTIASQITVGRKSHPFIFDRTTGQIIGSNEVKDVTSGTTINNIKIPALVTYLNDARSGKTGGGTFMDGKDEKIIAFSPVAGSNWSVGCIAPKTDFYSGLQQMILMMVIAFTAVILLSAGVCIFSVNFTVKPLKNLDKSIQSIASGNADLTQRISVTSKDEIGDVVSGFNTFTGKLMQIVSNIKSSKNTLSVSGDKLEKSTEDTAASITQILGDIGSVHSQISEQSSSVEETAGAVNQIAGNIQSLEQMIESQSASVTQASAAVEEMISNIRSVNSSVSKMALSFEDLQKEASLGIMTQKDLNERIIQIQDQSQTLQEANQAIANVSTQTNLLAMNAAIEAAHAGSAGKGFSVVADEIRKLSESSSKQSKVIGEQLASIKKSIEDVVAASETSSKTFSSVSANLTDTDSLVKQIQSALSENAEGSRQISDALHTMNDSTSSVRSASTEMTAGSKAILEEVRRLQQVTAGIKNSISEMNAGAEKINRNGTVLNEVSHEMKETISAIGSQIDQFTV